MTTINSVNLGLSGSTGTGNFVGANTPTLITPVLGVATATSIAFNPTTDGIIGTTAADNASAGYVGEFLQSAYATSVSMTSANTTNIQSLTLSAGDWDVWAVFYTTVGSGTITAQAFAGISAANNTLPTPSNASTAALASSIASSSPVNQGWFTQTGFSRWNVSTNTIIYLNAYVTFSVSTLAGNGAIFARRMR